MSIILWIITAFIICLLVLAAIKTKKSLKRKKGIRIGTTVLWIVAAAIALLFAENLYEFTIENEPMFLIDNEKSSIIEAVPEGDTIHYSASLCIRYRLPGIGYKNRQWPLKLYVTGKDGNAEHSEVVEAIITSPSDEDRIAILPLWGRQIECTFDITDFGAAFDIGCIKGCD